VDNASKGRRNLLCGSTPGLTGVLFSGSPLVVNPSLATLIGLDGAIILQQVHYWVSQNEAAGRNERDGFTWTYNTYDQWRHDFPFWSARSIRRTIGHLEAMGLLVSGAYNRMSMDQTKWYRINYPALSALCEGAARCGQIGQTMRPEWPDHAANLDRPIPETSTETCAENSSGSSSADDGSEGQIDAVIRAYSENVGPLTPVIRADIEAAVAEYGVQHVLGAIAVAARANDHTWRYVEGVLKRSRAVQKAPEADPDKYVRGAFGSVVRR
jgi:hypothetical protein